MSKPSGARRHVHKYFRLPIDGLWHCGDARCTHFMPGNMPPPLGKMTICWTCGYPFELTADHISKRAPDYPTHEDCPPYRAPMLNEADSDEFEDFTIALQKKTRENKLVEVVETEDGPVALHANDCPAWTGGECTCELKMKS